MNDKRKNLIPINKRGNVAADGLRLFIKRAIDANLIKEEKSKVDSPAGGARKLTRKKPQRKNRKSKKKRKYNRKKTQKGIKTKKRR